MSRTLEIELEKRICKAVVQGLLANGYTVGVNDGEETTLKRSNSVAEVMRHVFTTDEDTLIAYATDGKEVGWVYLVWGNVESLVSDYTTNLEAALTKANALADKYAA